MKNSILHFIIILLAGLFSSSCQNNKISEIPSDKPNIILILVDDLGIGDVSSYNPDSKIYTPNIDKLASEGLLFTDAHTSAAQCSPTRYGLLTGRYSWRTRLKTGVLPHFDEPLIESGRSTIASLLKNEGYNTACIGKWHLGLGWQTKDGEALNHISWSENQNFIIDYSKELSVSPNNYGFDYFFGINASNNMLPYCLIENNKVITEPELIKYPSYDTESDSALVSSDYDSENLESIMFEKAMSWLTEQVNGTNKNPFFLYYPMTAIHRPCLPVDAFKGSASAGLRGDKVVEVDHYIGKMLQWLEDNNIENNTLFIFTSDNGARPGDEMSFLAELAAHPYGDKYHPNKLIEQDRLQCANTPYDKPKGSESYYIYHHFSSGPYKGYKSDIYEGGHRVPFIIRWPQVIEAGTRKDDLVSTLDFFATFSELFNLNLADSIAEDSYSFLPALINNPEYIERPNLVHKAWQKDAIAIRKGDWKLIPFKNGGGLYRFIDVTEKGQLYNLKDDPQEVNNLYDQNPEIVRELTEELMLVKNQKLRRE